MTMELSKFRKVFQDIPECRTMLIRCLSGANLIALRGAVGFWLSDREKRAHLSLLWDVFEHIKWSEDTGGVTMMGRGLDFRRAEALMRESAIMHWKKVVPFIIMIRATFDHENLVPWIKQALSSITRSTKMTVTEAARRPNSWDTTPIATIEGLAAGVKISIPITTLAQESPQNQLGTATIDRTAAMSIFQPALNDVTRIAIAKVESDSIRYETANVAAYKTRDTFNICMFGPQFMTNASLIHKTPSEGPRYDWPDSPQVFTRVIDIYSPAKPGSTYAAWQRRNARRGW